MRQEIVFEYEHGDAKVKRNLQMLLDAAREGDTIITLEVSRLSRSTQQLCQIIDVIREKRLCLQIVGSITINCHNGQTDPMSEAFLQMAGVFSQLELAMIRARVKSGMANAKAKGKQDRTSPRIDRAGYPCSYSYRHYPDLRLGQVERAANWRGYAG